MSHLGDKKKTVHSSILTTAAGALLQGAAAAFVAPKLVECLKKESTEPFVRIPRGGREQSLQGALSHAQYPGHYTV